MQKASLSLALASLVGVGNLNLSAPPIYSTNTLPPSKGFTNALKIRRAARKAKRQAAHRRRAGHI